MLRASLAAVVAAIALILPAPAGAQQLHNVLGPAERDAGWVLLFNGHTTAGWRGYRRDSMPAGWQVVDGALTRVAEAGDIVTRDRYKDFDLRLDWKIAKGGNSGVMYRVSEDREYPWETGPEMQVLDNARHPDGKSELTAAGSCFAVYPAPRSAAHAAGEWNHARIVVRGSHVEHWLNGHMVVSYELGSPDWERRVKASKFAAMPGYGRNADGYISLQDHGDEVAFRDIRIRVLP